LVLLHSINAAPSAMEIRPLFEHYRDKRPVMAPDLPGFGLSDRAAVSYSAVQYARWIAQWLKDFKSPPDIVVLSLTGEFVARAILEQGTRVRSLTLISPTGMGTASPPSLPDGSRLERVLNSPWVGQSLFRALTTKASIRWFLNKAFVGQTPEYLVQYAWETARQPGAHLVPLKFLTFSLFTEQAMSRLYSRLTLPCLVLYDDDPNIGFERLSELADANDQWTIKRLVPSMGLPHWELPADTIKALDDFWGLSAQDAALSDDVAEQSARRESA
jgi:pimeloyl-ACP methyl ester carboxylesterase